jgi:hypothetical protein
MEPAAKGVGHIRAPRLGGVLADGADSGELMLRCVEVIDLHREAELARMILDDEDRVGRDVAPGLDRVEYTIGTRSTIARRNPRLSRCCGSSPR